MPIFPKQQQPQKPQHAATTGPVHKVLCPWCSVPNDFRELAGEEDGGVKSSWGTAGLERGAVMSCDHCQRKFKLADKQQITILKLVPVQ
ncbi:MAG TPA: hypothetical protein VFD36_20490 [Kofleriaceae bacterium]|nr:hypothetical protein [Kofleriaceae bacterium]